MRRTKNVRVGTHVDEPGSGCIEPGGDSTTILPKKPTLAISRKGPQSRVGASGWVRIVRLIGAAFDELVTREGGELAIVCYVLCNDFVSGNRSAADGVDLWVTSVAPKVDVIALTKLRAAFHGNGLPLT